MVLVYHQIIGRGGLEKYLLSLARALSQRGHDVRVVTACTDGAAEALGVGMTRVSVRGVHTTACSFDSVRIVNK